MLIHWCVYFVAMTEDGEFRYIEVFFSSQSTLVIFFFFFFSVVILYWYLPYYLWISLLSCTLIKTSFKEGRIKSNLVLIVLNKVDDRCKPRVYTVQDIHYFSC